jgi:hypothetical protein
MLYMSLWTTLSLFFGVYREFHHTSSLIPTHRHFLERNFKQSSPRYKPDQPRSIPDVVPSISREYSIVRSYCSWYFFLRSLIIGCH